ncbi:MAG: bL28 family ribosomal protein [Bacilli bacterium]
MAQNVSTKKPLFGNSRSHALNATKKKQKVNMQKVTLNGVTVVMSAQEAKKFRKNEA